MILLYYEQNFYKIMSQFLEGGLFFFIFVSISYVTITLGKLKLN